MIIEKTKKGDKVHVTSARDAQRDLYIKRIGKNIKRERIDKEMTQVELGKALGISGTMVGNIENGNVKRLDIMDVYKIAEVLEVDPSQLMTTAIAAGFQDRRSHIYSVYLGLTTAYRKAKSRHTHLEIANDPALDFILDDNPELEKPITTICADLSGLLVPARHPLFNEIKDFIEFIEKRQLHPSKPIKINWSEDDDILDEDYEPPTPDKWEDEDNGKQ